MGLKFLSIQSVKERHTNSRQEKSMTAIILPYDFLCTLLSDMELCAAQEQICYVSLKPFI